MSGDRAELSTREAQDPASLHTRDGSAEARALNPGAAGPSMPAATAIQLQALIGNRALASLARGTFQREGAARLSRDPTDGSGPTIGNLPRDVPHSGKRVKLKLIDGKWKEVLPGKEHIKGMKWRRAAGWYDFVLQNGEIFAEKSKGPYGHTEAARGGRVTWAGQVRFTSRSGQVVEWNEGSGHYRSASYFKDSVVNAGFPEGKFRRHPQAANSRPGPQLPVYQPGTRPRNGRPPQVPRGPPRLDELEAHLRESKLKTQAAPSQTPNTSVPTPTGTPAGVRVASGAARAANAAGTALLVMSLYFGSKLAKQERKNIADGWKIHVAPTADKKIERLQQRWHARPDVYPKTKTYLAIVYSIDFEKEGHWLLGDTYFYEDMSYLWSSVSTKPINKRLVPPPKRFHWEEEELPEHQVFATSVLIADPVVWSLVHDIEAHNAESAFRPYRRWKGSTALRARYWKLSAEQRELLATLSPAFTREAVAARRAQEQAALEQVFNKDILKHH